MVFCYQIAPARKKHMFGYQIRARKKRLNTTSLRRYSRPGECKGKFDERKVALRFGLVNYYVSLPQNLRE